MVEFCFSGNQIHLISATELNRTQSIQGTIIISKIFPPLVLLFETNFRKETDSVYFLFYVLLFT